MRRPSRPRPTWAAADQAGSSAGAPEVDSPCSRSCELLEALELAAVAVEVPEASVSVVVEVSCST
jgi:hypothetical protein